MRFLFIDDDDLKVEMFTWHLPKEDSVKVIKYGNAGLVELVENADNYDCLILDMNFPRFENGMVQSNEGLRVLRTIKRRGISIPTVIYSSKRVNVSEYDNIKDYILCNGLCDFKARIAALKKALA